MKLRPIDLGKLKTNSVRDRINKVNIEDFGRPWRQGGKFKSFMQCLPDIQIGKDFKHVVNAVVNAVHNNHLILCAMGAHIIKCGLSPIIIDLIEENIVGGVALNGAGMIHDFEIAYMGMTSEDVASGLQSRTFGMGRETADILNEVTKQASDRDVGLGSCVGQKIHQLELPHRENSIVYACFRRNVPVTIHVAIGTDIIHMHPSFDGGAVGKATYRDFRLFTSMVSQLEGGVYFNIGSSVVLPEIFLKAVSITKNLGYQLDGITTVNMDFIAHYRPMENVVKRPTLPGKGYYIPGCHEIMIPMLAAAIKEYLHE